MPERTFDDFDAHAREYRDVHTKNIRLSGTDSFYFAEMKVRLLKSYESNRVLKVLDVGCGDGVTEMYMNRYFPAWIVNGIDVSKRSIEIAMQQALPNVVFEKYDGRKIPYGNGQFDIVFMAGVLHHVHPDLHAGLLSEINRVMKKDGRFYLFEHNPLNPVTKHLVNTCVFDKDAQLLKSSYALRLLRQAGLSVNNKKFIIFFPRHKFFSWFISLEKFLGWMPLGGQYMILATK